MEHVATAGSAISSFPTDLVAAVILFVILSAVILWRKNRMFISMTIAFYPAAVLYAAFPYTDQIIVASSPMAAFINEVLLLIVFIILLYFVIDRFTTRHTGASSGSAGMMTAVLLALSIIIEIALVVVYLIPADDVIPLSSIATRFMGEQYAFFWMLVPPALLYIVSKTKKKV